MFIYLFVIDPFLPAFSSVPGIWTHVRNNAVGDKGTSEFLSVKSGVKVTEETIDSNVCGGKLADDFIQSALYLEEVGMISFLWFGHGKRNALIIRKEKRIGRTSLLPTQSFLLRDKLEYGNRQSGIGTIY